MPVIPARWEAEVVGSPEVRSLRPAWPTWWNPVFTKNTKISWAWWCVPVVPATREAEAGESLEPGRRRLQWAEITPLHSSLATEWDSISKTKMKAKTKQKRNKGKRMGLLDTLHRNFQDSLTTEVFKWCYGRSYEGKISMHSPWRKDNSLCLLFIFSSYSGIWYRTGNLKKRVNQPGRNG